MSRVSITGNTFPVKDQIKALGGKWDGDNKCWTVPAAKADEARKLVANAPEQKPLTPGKCRDCGKECKAPFTLCFDCKGKAANRNGKCAKCGGSLDNWERKHGMRNCGDCRDGGSRAHGGQSYYDRNGNFVLGDDD